MKGKTAAWEKEKSISAGNRAQLKELGTALHLEEITIANRGSPFRNSVNRSLNWKVERLPAQHQLVIRPLLVFNTTSSVFEIFFVHIHIDLCCFVWFSSRLLSLNCSRKATKTFNVSDQQQWPTDEGSYPLQMLPCPERRNALSLMWVPSVWRLCCLFCFFLFTFWSSSEVMNGNRYNASGDVSRSSLFCAAKHDLWQEGERESLTSPFAHLHFHILAQKEFWGVRLTRQPPTSVAKHQFKLVTIQCELTQGGAGPPSRQRQEAPLVSRCRHCFVSAEVN